jgi:N-ethylmaleimide reductase
MTRERGNELIADGLADLVAFGETFIANPDLPERFASLAPIERSDRSLHYSPGAHSPTIRTTPHDRRACRRIREC